MAGAFEEQPNTETNHGSERAEKQSGNQDALDLRSQWRFRPGSDPFDFGNHTLRNEHPRAFDGVVRGEHYEEHVHLSQDESNNGASFDEVDPTHDIPLKRARAFEQRTKASDLRTSLTDLRVSLTDLGLFGAAPSPQANLYPWLCQVRTLRIRTLLRGLKADRELLYAFQ